MLDGFVQAETRLKFSVNPPPLMVLDMLLLGHIVLVEAVQLLRALLVLIVLVGKRLCVPLQQGNTALSEVRQTVLHVRAAFTALGRMHLLRNVVRVNFVVQGLNRQLRVLVMGENIVQQVHQSIIQN